VAASVPLPATIVGVLIIGVMNNGWICSTCRLLAANCQGWIIVVAVLILDKKPSN